MEEVKTKKECLNYINIVIKSCKEDKTGDWDCSTEEGKEGFDCMVEVLEEVKKYIKTRR